MKNKLKVAVVATVVGLASMHAWADQTNLVRNLTIDLSGFQQDGVSTSKNVTTLNVTKVSIGNAEVISALGTATGNSFSANAQLFVITPAYGGGSSVVIRDSGNSVDVTAFFGQGELSDTVGKSTSNSKTGKATGSNYSIQEFSLVDPGGYDTLSLHYDVNGLTTENFSIPAVPGPRSELKADVSGTGDVNGALVILQGTIKVTGQTVEVVVGGPGGPPA